MTLENYSGNEVTNNIKKTKCVLKIKKPFGYLVLVSFELNGYICSLSCIMPFSMKLLIDIFLA